MRSSTDSKPFATASTVWRDALGPGFAVGVAEGLLRVAGAVAARPYRSHR